MDTREINGAEDWTPWRNVSDLERWGSVAAGSVMIAYGLVRRTPRAAMLAVAGTPLVYRGMTGHCVVYEGLGVTTAADTKAALGGDAGVRVKESIRIERPVEELYRFWRRLENLPQCMDHLVRVEDRGDGRSHWVAKGPAGTKVEWDAEIFNDIENKLIAWKSLPGSSVVTAGSVHFDRVRDGRTTQITVTLQYSPPAGKLGSWAAWLFGREPSQTVREDLRRIKQVLEAGEVPRAHVTSGARAGGVQ
jgi:uncharacterized membrane protein